VVTDMPQTPGPGEPVRLQLSHVIGMDEALAGIRTQLAQLPRLLPTTVPAVKLALPADLNIIFRAMLEPAAFAALSKVTEIARQSCFEQLEQVIRGQQVWLGGMDRAFGLAESYRKISEMQDQVQASLRFAVPHLSELAFPSKAIAVTLHAMSEALARAVPGDALRLRTLALRPVWEFEVFTQKVLEGIGDAKDESPTANAAGRIVEAAAVETTAGSELTIWLLETMRGPFSVDDLPPGTLPTFNLFAVQQFEMDTLLGPEGVAEGSAIVTYGLPASITAQRARSVCHLMAAINEIRDMSGGEAVFKPTNRLFEGAASLPFLIAVDRPTLKEFVDWLYQLIYEGSGSAKRVLAYLEDSECGALWMVKHLRTWGGHDIDHGDQGTVKRKKKLVADAFRYLIGKPTPQSVADFRSAQLRLLYEIGKMLQVLKARLADRDAKNIS